MASILKGQRTTALIGAAIFGLMLAGTPASAQVKIGFQAPLTGPAATDGVSAKVAAELAIAGAGGVFLLSSVLPYVRAVGRMREASIGESSTVTWRPSNLAMVDCMKFASSRSGKSVR